MVNIPEACLGGEGCASLKLKQAEAARAGSNRVGLCPLMARLALLRPIATPGLEELLAQNTDECGAGTRNTIIERAPHDSIGVELSIAAMKKALGLQPPQEINIPQSLELPVELAA